MAKVVTLNELLQEGMDKFIKDDERFSLIYEEEVNEDIIALLKERSRDNGDVEGV